jgi:Polysaccharide deacetylase
MLALEHRHDIVEDVVALTFDDSPSPWTGSILDLLAAHEGHATFFGSTVWLPLTVAARHCVASSRQARRSSANGSEPDSRFANRIAKPSARRLPRPDGCRSAASRTSP